MFCSKCCGGPSPSLRWWFEGCAGIVLYSLSRLRERVADRRTRSHTRPVRLTGRAAFGRSAARSEWTTRTDRPRADRTRVRSGGTAAAGRFVAASAGDALWLPCGPHRCHRTRATAGLRSGAQRIADYLKEQGWRQIVGQYLQRLSGRAKVKGVDFSEQTQTLLL